MSKPLHHITHRFIHEKRNIPQHIKQEIALADIVGKAELKRKIVNIHYNTHVKRCYMDALDTEELDAFKLEGWRRRLNDNEVE